MDSLSIIEGIQEAIKVLRKAQRQTCIGAACIYILTAHAEDHLNKQIRELLAA